LHLVLQYRDSSRSRRSNTILVREKGFEHEPVDLF
jgi:hypothetical protein